MSVAWIVVLSVSYTIVGIAATLLSLVLHARRLRTRATPGGYYEGDIFYGELVPVASLLIWPVVLVLTGLYFGVVGLQKFAVYLDAKSAGLNPAWRPWWDKEK